MRFSRKTLIVIASFAAALLLSACGDGGLNPGVQKYQLTIQIEGNGSVELRPEDLTCIESCTYTFDANRQFQLVADPQTVAWGGDCAGTPSGQACVIIMNKNHQVSAHFGGEGKVEHTLTVSKTGNGSGTVTSSPLGIECGNSCNSDSADFDAGTTVTLQANPVSGSFFAGWSGAGCSGAGSCAVTMNIDHAVTANFMTIPPGEHPVVVNVNGNGSVTSNPAGIDCKPSCTATFSENSSMQLTAQPDSGWSFVGWEGSCSGTGTCTLNMNNEKNVTATFAPDISEESIYPVSSTCDGVSSGQSCTVSIHLMNSTSGYAGFEFSFSSSGFELRAAQPGALTEGCFAQAGPSKVAVVCDSRTSGDGEIAVLTLRRTQNTGSSLVVQNAYVAKDASSKTAVQGGSLAVASK